MIIDFVARNGEHFSENDIAAIMRRTSICNDVRLSFLEFERFILSSHYQAKSIRGSLVKSSISVRSSYQNE
jgi:hypothetical protein